MSVAAAVAAAADGRGAAVCGNDDGWKLSNGCRKYTGGSPMSNTCCMIAGGTSKMQLANIQGRKIGNSSQIPTEFLTHRPPSPAKNKLLSRIHFAADRRMVKGELTALWTKIEISAASHCQHRLTASLSVPRFPFRSFSPPEIPPVKTPLQ